MSNNKKTSVLGIYSTREAVDDGTEVLVRSGFSASDISILLPKNLGPRSISAEKATKAPEGTAAGVTSGAVVGGGIGLLAGIGALSVSSFMCC